MVTHDVISGINVCSRPRGRPCNERPDKVIECPDDVENEMVRLRSILDIERSDKMLLMLSVATDEMIRVGAMHPEVWFMDVTGGTNIEKKDLFVIAVRTTCGKTFPVNLTIVPSGKRFVYDWIYKVALLCLFGPVTMSRNRLALTDDDYAEHSAFDNAIGTSGLLDNSLHMLCLFHALWMPYKEFVFPTLPKKKNSPLLTEEGEDWGKCAWLHTSVNSLVMHVNSHNRLWSTHTV